MRDFEAIVVGAGPAGCAAAYDLAGAGVRVLLLDRNAFPRRKPCAGALSIKSIKRLRYSIAPVIQFVARDLEVSFRGGGERIFESPHPIAVMTVREELDAYCLQQTIGKGAHFRQIGDIAKIEEHESGVALTTAAGEEFSCRYLVGADGANSRVRRLIGAGASPKALAVEGHVPRAACRRDPMMRFDFGFVPGGYGWIFPKGDHVNVGLYTQRADIKLSKRDLADYAQAATGADEIEAIVGYPIAVGGESYQPRQQRIFLAGDAAGMSERLLGEGIHNALCSGQAAAQAIAGAVLRRENAQARFCEGVHLLQRDLEACRIAAHWFYDLRFLGLAKLFPIPRSKALTRGFAAGLTFREIMRSVFAPPFRAIQPVHAVLEFEQNSLA